VIRPVLHVPLLRERNPAASPNPAPRPATAPRDGDANAAAIDKVTINDGTIIFSSLRDRVENRLSGINAEMRVGEDRKVSVSGAARAGERPLKFDIKATAPHPPLERQNIPVELTLDAPGTLQAPLVAKAEVRLNGKIAMINGITGTLGDGAFNGWASVDLTSKPLVKLDLDFQRLDVAIPKAPATAGQAPQAWSHATIDTSNLNYVDAEARISAAELSFGDVRVAPAAIDVVLGSSVLKANFANLGAYGGQASGELTIDASTANPAYTLRSDLTGVRALPLLKSAADFDKLDGKLQAKIAVRSSGASQHAIMAGMSGTVFAVFQDGAIKGLNVAQMVRSLTSNTLSGWQEGKEQATDLAQLSASFRIDKGLAATSDLNLVGPLVKMTGAGNIDLGTRMLAFRVEPKLVMTTEGQGRAADPVGLGIPVVIEGSWAEPRIYPEMTGILENPDAAYAKLKEMGKGLFGPGGLSGLGLGGSGSGNTPGGAPGDPGTGGGLSDLLGGKLGETLGNLLQQGIGQGQPGGRRNQPRSMVPGIPEPAAPPAPPPAPAQNAPAPDTPDSAAMNDVLRQLFNR
jgi:AsmA protein